MRLLLIIILLMIAFPIFRRIVGSLLSVVFWLIVPAAVLAVVGAISG
jgi:hypothetical protein